MLVCLRRASFDNSLLSCQVKVDDAASKNFPWPNASQLGDPLRAMVVCGTGQFSQPKMVWDKIHASFDVREGHGHVKPNFSVKDRPPDMLINVVIETPDHMPVIGEIQIHYRPCLLYTSPSPRDRG